MLTNNTIKLIKTLDSKKSRRENGLFVVEGEKMIKELLTSKFDVVEIFATQPLFNELSQLTRKGQIISEISEKDLNRISFLKTPNQALGLVRLPKESELRIPNGLSIALDNIQDPGNLGTIVRTAAWFGVNTVFCSPETVDLFNPKVIQSTMGAIFRVNVCYTYLSDLIIEANKLGIATYGTRLDGSNIYKHKLPKSAIVFMGNESKGLSPEISKAMSNNLLIPSYAKENGGIESLNVSIATAITCAEFMRQNG
ncbi:MAG: RNA methyltransferase [Salinivirgaceae bacterium]|nr:RNA methyltransferase [Salinivirgaceae bacterium]